MKLISLYVENFGVLHSVNFDFRAGLNVFCRENGAGKTTLAAFLCAMLYGLGTSRKTDPDENDRKKYLPWQGGPFGGSMTFSVRGKTYRAERYFADGASVRRDSFVLYDLADNSVSHDYTEALGVQLFGIDAAAFARSAYLPQRLLSGDRSAQTESITAQLIRAMDGGDAGEDGGMYRTAAAVLDRQRQYYVKQGGRGYIADLERAIADLHAEEYTAMQAKNEAQAYSEEAAAADAALAALTDEKERLTALTADTGKQAAVIAHGRSLLAHRDDALSAAAQKRQFLHLDDDAASPAVPYTAEAHSAAEETLRTCTRLELLLAEADEACARNRTVRAQLAERFVDGIPGADRQKALADALEQVRMLPAAEADVQPLPACFSDEEIARHTRQALMHAQVTEQLEQPREAQAQMRAAFAAVGLSEGDALPDEDTVDAYADTLGALDINREKQVVLIPQKQEADDALAAYRAAHEGIPAREEIVTMRSRFDALHSRNEEIEELEARQRAAVQADETIRRSRRIRIAVGIGLLLVTAVFAVLYAFGHDSRMLIAAGGMALPGLILLIAGILTRSDESDETRALEDAAQKRLCAKKSEYEAEKTALYEFLDRIGGSAELVLDLNEAKARFDAAAAAAREGEVLSERAQILGTQLQTLKEGEAQLCASLSSYTKSGGGELPDLGEDRAAFHAFRRALSGCVQAQRAYAAEQEARTLAQAQADALAIALDRYLDALLQACPADMEKPVYTDADTYSDRMAAWSRFADAYRLQHAEQQRRNAAHTSAVEQLTAALSEMQITETHTADAVSAAEEVLGVCRQAQEAEAQTAVLLERRTALGAELTVHRASLDTYLTGFFAQPLPDADRGLQTIRSTAEALDDDMNRLRIAQRTLQTFLNEHAMTEEQLRTSGVTSEDARRTSEAQLRASEAQIRQKTEEKAALLQKAEAAFRQGAVLPALREKRAAAEQALAEARDALEVIRQTQMYLEEAQRAMSMRYLAHMQARFRFYWSRLTGMTEDEARAMSLDASFSVRTEVLGARRDAVYFSRGVRDCIDFCVRLAMIDAMYTDGGTKTDAPLPPLLLDDPFVNLDQTHLTAARAMLEEIADRFQILYFVCHESRV